MMYPRGGHRPVDNGKHAHPMISTTCLMVFVCGITNGDAVPRLTTPRRLQTLVGREE